MRNYLNIRLIHGEYELLLRQSVVTKMHIRY